MLNLYGLEQRVEERMRAAKVPGLALAIVRDGEVTYARGFGVTSVEDGGTPVTPQTLFRIGSTTKPLTGTAVMRLVEAGKLDLDRPVREYIPWLRFSADGAAERITLRLLMSHTAGLPTAAEHFGPRDPAGLERHIREDIPQLPFIAPPGKVYSYSNAGINLVGYVAEVVGGKPFAELMREQVFGPLAMERTTFDPTVALTYPLAQSHDVAPDGALRVQHRFADNTAHYPSGFVMSTVLDLANFAMMQLGQGRFRDQQILSPESVAAMQTLQADLYTTNGAGYGLTFGVETYKGIRLVGHAGGISTFGSQFKLAPDAGAAVLLLYNRISPEFAAERLVHDIFDQLLDLPQEAPKPRAIAPDRSLWPRYVGSYVGIWAGLATIQTVDDQLTLDLNGEAVPLDALRPDLYFGLKSGSEEPTSVGFVPEATGPTEFIMVDGAPAERIQLDTAFTLDPATWAAYAGTYGGVDRLTVSVEDGRLFIASAFYGKRVPCTPLDNRRFASEYGLVEFQVAQDGPVPALKVAKSIIHPRVDGYSASAP